MIKKQRDYLEKHYRSHLPIILNEWLDEARTELEKLTKACLSPDVSDAEFTKLMEEWAKDPHKILNKLNVSSLTNHLTDTMGSYAAIGKTEMRIKFNERKNNTQQRLSHTQPKRTKKNAR